MEQGFLSPLRKPDTEMRKLHDRMAKLEARLIKLESIKDKQTTPNLKDK